MALTVKVVANLSTDAIARAGIPYRVPPEELLPGRLDGVLAVVYLVSPRATPRAPGPSPMRRFALVGCWSS